MVGLGIVTYNRPERFATLAASLPLVNDEVDVAVAFEDGASGADYVTALDKMPNWIHFERFQANVGVGRVKNALMRRLLEAGCDWLIISEDDVVIRSPLAVRGYVEAAQESGWDHLSFHAHGPANPVPVALGRSVTLWPNYVGAWCLYSRRCLEEVGLMDEHFFNAWEHVEHSLRLSLAGYHPLPEPGRLVAADATGSEDWVEEQPGSVTDSVIRPRPDWAANIEVGKTYWRETYPDTYRLIWPGG